MFSPPSCHSVGLFPGLLLPSFILSRFSLLGPPLFPRPTLPLSSSLRRKTTVCLLRKEQSITHSGPTLRGGSAAAAVSHFSLFHCLLICRGPRHRASMLLFLFLCTYAAVWDLCALHAPSQVDACAASALSARLACCPDPVYSLSPPVKHMEQSSADAADGQPGFLWLSPPPLPLSHHRSLRESPPPFHLSLLHFPHIQKTRNEHIFFSLRRKA